MWTTPDLAPLLLTTAPHQRVGVSALDRFKVHRFPIRWVFSGTGLELMTCLPWSDTLTTGLLQPFPNDLKIKLRNGCPAETHPHPTDVEQERVVKGDVEQVEHVANNSAVCQYNDYRKFSTTHDEFKTKFLENNFGAVCSVCDRLWHENNVKKTTSTCKITFLT
ncbi:hypothetical protein TNCV_1001611 [Trichonephila clavipes]|nr:hypothetical protein TNCV_1001611 [Trichonephila clavipes]